MVDWKYPDFAQKFLGHIFKVFFIRKTVVHVHVTHASVSPVIHVAAAQNDDVIMIAGKGHENYQEINGTKYHFDDKEIVEELLSEL